MRNGELVSIFGRKFNSSGHINSFNAPCETNSLMGRPFTTIGPSPEIVVLLITRLSMVAIEWSSTMENIDYPTLLDPRPTMYDCEQNIPGWRTPRDHQEVSRRLLALNYQYERHGPKINFSSGGGMSSNDWLEH